MKTRSLLRRSRRAAGLSQRELAARAGVPQSTIGRIEAEIIDPRCTTLFKILEACGHEVETWRRLGEGVDRTQIREFLSLTPRERVDAAVVAAQNVRGIRRSRPHTR